MRSQKILFIVLSILVMVAHCQVGYAQNYGNAIPAKEIKSVDDLTTEQIEQLLIQEGVPIDRSISLPQGDESKYTLGISDVIEVSVMRHPEVTGQYIINSEGKIQYEFVGDVEIAGLTKKEVSALLTKQLEKFIISPEVTVKIVGYNSKVVYVVGEVGRPGKIYMRGDTITVREALVQASLPLLTAKAKDGRLITPADTGKADLKKVNIHKLLYEGDLRENLVMKPGDTLYVPPTVMTKALRAIQPVAAPISTSAGTARTVTTGF